MLVGGVYTTTGEAVVSDASSCCEEPLDLAPQTLVTGPLACVNAKPAVGRLSTESRMERQLCPRGVTRKCATFRCKGSTGAFPLTAR